MSITTTSPNNHHSTTKIIPSDIEGTQPPEAQVKLEANSIQDNVHYSNKRTLPPSPPPGHKKGHDQCVQQLRLVLDSKVKVTVTDNRVFTGVLKCLDYDRNLVLADSFEDRNGVSRYVALIMIPGKHIVKFEVSDFIYRRLAHDVS